MSDLRNTGDAWVTSEDGSRYWGRFGAAGLLAHDPQRGVLLQHRVDWSDHGGTWGIPGGARHESESAIDAAFRESAEEASVPRTHLIPRYTHVLDRGVWSYTTIIAEVTQAFEPVINDAESHELRWVPVTEVSTYPLHPAFASSWEVLQPLLQLTTVVVIDAANVVGSVPDGWWRDRPAANTRLRNALVQLAETGLDAFQLLPEDISEARTIRVFPRWIMVTEGQATAVTSLPPLEVSAAPADGDTHILQLLATELRSGDRVTVVSSDRDLAERANQLGVRVVGSSWLRIQLAEHTQPQ